MRSRINGTESILRSLVVGLCTWAATGCGPLQAEHDIHDVDVGAVQAGVSSASGTIGGKPVWAHFSNPPAFAGRDYTIITELRRLINSTPAGATIRGTIHSISIDEVADALLAAQNRGVAVYVVLDGKNASSTDPAIAKIKSLTNHRFCTNTSGGGGCIGTSAAGNMHTKMFTFSQTTDPTGVARSNVVWFGSSNLTYASGPDAFNNTITIYDEATLFTGLNANFSDMFNRRHYTGNDYYDSASGRGYYMATAADAYASPEGLNQTDTIVTRLNDVTPDANCRLRIGMSFVTTGRPDILAQVKRYRAGGCAVWMVVGGDATAGISMPQSVYNELLDAGVAIRRKDKVHDKFFLIYGKYGTSYAYRVYTGSQNWSQDALNENEEIFVKMSPETGTVHPLYDGFYNHFNDAYNTGVTCTKANYPCK
ncbi:phospholipase D-like domain-containing protein [Archangium sp.]|uniref:phospholipase D-like domain-containing protein n=1 Tax=Archangium sp. TaxID=1872627 RepID=UPI002D3F7D27|nr:phospholipase D-like domain-containing protein [Archangium sp.]HYO54490.1 phospholipase D-like domain-containing protein [Archangium sp.]